MRNEQNPQQPMCEADPAMKALDMARDEAKEFISLYWRVCTDCPQKAQI